MRGLEGGDGVGLGETPGWMALGSVIVARLGGWVGFSCTAQLLLNVKFLWSCDYLM